MQKGIAVAGNLIVDHIKYIESYPEPQTLTTITEAARSTGGLCCNCVLALAKLDPTLPVKALGLVGRDEAGDYILSRFAAHPCVDTSRILRHGNTSYTDVMTVRETGRRTFFHYRGSNALLSPGHFDFTGLDADILHVGYILLLDSLDAADSEYPTAMCRVLDSAQKSGVLTSIDVVSEAGGRFAKLVPPALKYTDYCIINEFEASMTTGVLLRDEREHLLADNLPVACEKLLGMGVGRWVVLHMPEMSCGMEKGGGYVCEPSWKIPQNFKKSSVGAGDAFASGILYGAYHGWDLRKSIHTAGAVAAYSLSGAGACDALVPLPELLAEMEAYQR